MLIKLTSAIKKFAAVTAVVFSANTHAGIPVIDVANLVQAVQQVLSWVQQASQMVQQIQGIQQQVQAAEQQVQAMTGSRLLGLILNDPRLQNYLPVDAHTVYQQLGQQGYTGLTPQARTIRDNSMIYNCVGVSADYQNICSKTLNQNSQDISFSRNAFETATDRNNQIQGLMAEINNTTDPKQIAELQARITAEGVAVQNEQNRIALWKGISAANHRAAEQEAKEWYIDANKRPSVISGFRATP